jgi:hypothetical protein
MPARLHSRDTSVGGTPAWHKTFERWLMAGPGAKDRDGYIVSPLKWWVSRLPRQQPAFVYLLAACDFDWRMASRIHGVRVEDAAHWYTSRVLNHLHRLMYDEHGLPREPVFHERGDCAEQGCPQLTSGLYCRNHRKSEAQMNAEALDGA